MDKPPFAVWAPLEIARLRTQADQLEVALNLYLGSAPEVPLINAPRAQRSAGEEPRGRGSKYEAIFKEFDKAGRVLTIDDMMSIALKHGVQFDRSNMRSQVFSQKKIGRCAPQGSGYIWGLSSKNETAPTEEESAVQ